MATGFIDLDRGDYMNNGVSPRQRKVYVLRWNPSISSYTKKEFLDDLEWYKDGAAVNSEKWGQDKRMYWNVHDWKTVEYMDLFVLVKVGHGATGIIGYGFLHSYPLQAEREDGSLGRTRYFQLTFQFMQNPEQTKLLTGEDLSNSIPDVNWMHGHSGELLSVENAEKLGILMVDQLKHVQDGEHLQFDDYNQKKYVLSDIITFMCPKLKKRLLDEGKNDYPEINDINNLMATIIDESYSQWTNIEDHLRLTRLNGLMM